MRVLVSCDGTHEDIAGLSKLHAHRCFVLTKNTIPLPFVTTCNDIPKLRFDVAVQLNDHTLDVDCKCVVIRRNPLRIHVRENGRETLLRQEFTTQLVNNQPADAIVRKHMEQHLFHTLITRSPVDVEAQMHGLSKFVNAVSVYHHRFKHDTTHELPTDITDLAATIAYVANGTYNRNNKSFNGSISHLKQRLSSYHIPCASLVAFAVALTPTCNLPTHTLQRII